MFDDPKGSKPLASKKQELFCQEYLIDLNATAAAGRAGYKDFNSGRQLIAKNNVSDRIAYLMSLRSQRTEVKQDRVLEELADIAFSNFTDLARWDGEYLTFTPSDELNLSAQRSVKAVKLKRTTRSDDNGETVTVEMEMSQHDKLSALDKLCKHLGMYRPEEGSGRTSGLDALVELLAARRRERQQERG